MASVENKSEALTFFFIGSRRSGTTMLRNVLNAHPDIYCSYESGIMWILRHLYIGGTVPSAEAETGHWAHIKQTFKYARDVFVEYVRSDHSLDTTRDAFFRALDACRRGRTEYDGIKNGPFVSVGEKDPSEYSLHEMNQFILNVHPGTKFIHPVRHPFAFARGVNENPLRIWMRNEKWALNAEREAPTFRFRYEDLCADPELWVGKLYRFLVPETANGIVSVGSRLVGKSGNEKYKNMVVPDWIDGLKEISAEYGYE